MRNRIRGYALMFGSFLALCVVWPKFGIFTIAFLFTVGILVFIAACILGFTGLLAKAGALIFGEVWLTKHLAKKNPYDKPEPVPTSSTPTMDQVRANLAAMKSNNGSEAATRGK